jgi:hypothetical protein
VLTIPLPAEVLGHGIYSIRRVLDATDEVVCILTLETLIEREGLQAGKADEVRVLDLFGRDAVAAQQFCLNLADLMQIENDR